MAGIKVARMREGVSIREGRPRCKEEAAIGGGNHCLWEEGGIKELGGLVAAWLRITFAN